MKYCWTTVYVRDLDQSIKFYKEIIGLKLNRRANVTDTRELAFLGEGETQIELICDKSVGEPQIGSGISLGFVTESLEEMITFLGEKGIDVHSGPKQPNPTIRFFYVLDPNGVKIQFVEFVKAK
ncbi:VOC family protein [Chitinispirillales bacterium ANBcel5]|uniref:VOC family protein n=1 Tax=Cellulosispirillum alkaliphilum TaxID=3039283 RepID=UPI002A588230|nr:VOC family protein [Chitinispirillales bacterium ANBcel5]